MLERGWCKLTGITSTKYSVDWLIELSHSTQTRSFRKHFPKPISWLGTEKKLNLTQQKHTFINQKKCTTTQKTKARFSRLLRHLAWKWSRFILKGKGGDKYEKVKKKDNWGSIQYKQANNIYTVSQKKQDTKLLIITSPNVNRFSKFFHW